MRHIMRYCTVTRHLVRDERWLKAAACVYDVRITDRELLRRWYIDEKLSILDIAKRLCCDHLVVHRAFVVLDIPKRTQSASRKIAQPKTVATCMERYGAPNPLSKGTKCELARNETVKQRYDVDNVFQDVDIMSTHRRNMSTGGPSNEKRLNTLQQRYGVRTPFARPEIRAKIAKSFLGGAKGRYISNLNRRAYEVLQQHEIEYEPEFMITENGRTLSYDLRVGNVLIELNGDHPHANPSTHLADDVILMPGQRYIASEIWKRDAEKTQIAKARGYKIVTLWESDLKHDFTQCLLRAIDHAT